MKILMLSSNTGEGHNSAAKAVMEVLDARNIDCEMRDCLACLSPKFSKFICSWHTRLYKYAPKLSNAGFRVIERNSEQEDAAPVYELLAMGAKNLWELLMEGEYDCVVCVHLFSALMMTEVRKTWGVKIPCFFVATDYSCTPLLDQCDMDGYFIPASSLEDEFTAAGIPCSRLIPSGIPVRQAFYSRGDRDQTRELLDLPKDKLIVLLMCGSMGCGPMGRIARDLVERLPEKAMVVAICGRNERLYDTLAGEQSPRLRVLGFVKNVPEYMDAADMAVTKPGGLSTTEAANKHLPMVLINAVGGCEEKNFRGFLHIGCAVGSNETDKVIAQAVKLAENPEALAEIRRNLREKFQTNSAQVIADRVAAAGECYFAVRLARRKALGIEPIRSGHPLLEKGGDTMEKNPQGTIQNLARAFAGESQARNRYTIYAQVARKEGYEWIARVLEETADNEAVHAEEFLEMLQKLGGCADNIEITAGYPYTLGDTVENLAAAAAGERHEHDEIYPAFAELARREGCDDAAKLFMQITRIEGVHHNAFLSLHDQLVGGTLTEKEEPVTWRCLNCGYTYTGTRACDPCPVCGKPVGWQAGTLDQRKMMAKK